MTERRTTAILSHHATTDGRVTYVRAPDGGLQVWLEPAAGAPHLVGEGRTDLASRTMTEVVPAGP